MSDPSGNLRGVNEQIVRHIGFQFQRENPNDRWQTDKAREAVEKVTGKKISANVSN